jgi:hypothetical protein
MMLDRVKFDVAERRTATNSVGHLNLHSLSDWTLMDGAA